MNNFNENFVVRKVLEEYDKEDKPKTAPQTFCYHIKSNFTGDETSFIMVIDTSPPGGVMGFGIYFGKKNKLIIYDSNGDIISYHHNLILKDLRKKRVRKRITIKKE